MRLAGAELCHFGLPGLANTLMTLVVLPLLVGVSGFAVAWLRKKTQEITEPFLPEGGTGEAGRR